MSVPEYERGEGKFTVLIEANNLVCYTLQICSNEKNFDPKFQKVIMDDIVQTTKSIFIDAFTANEIKVDNADDAKDRLKLIKHSITACNRVFALLQIAKKLYHIDSKRVKYWGTKIKTTKELLKKWYLSERKRYSVYL